MNRRLLSYRKPFWLAIAALVVVLGGMYVLIIRPYHLRWGATDQGLALPALVCAALAAIPAALIGALAALAIRALLALRTATPTPRRAGASRLAVCLVVSLALLALLTQAMGVTWTPATAATLTFWLVAPLVLYVIAGTVASWQLGRKLAA